jgi:septum formation protein
MPNLPLVLASSSPYRQALLEKLKVHFISEAPSISEVPFPLETPERLAMRLSIAKAQALQARYNHHLIIGADQVAVLQQQFLAKPGDRNTAIQQLQTASNQCVEFFTGLCVLNSVTGEYLTEMDVTRVYFKPLTLSQIERYVDVDSPLDCAGSFKVENLGIALFEKIVSEDHNALIGLPLIKLIKLLEKFQCPVL